MLLAPFSLSLGPIIGAILGAVEAYQIEQHQVFGIGEKDGKQIRKLQKQALKECVKAGAIGYFICAQIKWQEAKLEQTILEDESPTIGQPRREIKETKITPEKEIARNRAEIKLIEENIEAIKKETESSIATFTESYASEKNRIFYDSPGSEPLATKEAIKKMKNDLNNNKKQLELRIKKSESERDKEIKKLQSKINKLEKK